MSIVRAIALSLGLFLATAASATANDLRSVAGMQNRNRVLLAFSPSLADSRLHVQRAIMARLAIESAKRDLLFVQIDPRIVIGASDKGDSLRRRFKVPVSTFQTVLIDKGGRILGKAAGPINGAAILRAIDGTPVRQAEVDNARHGLTATGAAN